ncbi:tRNA1(Val) (adenine(37)-N6)-methyltransferase [Ruegeria arenilitoris]|uniref:tRNA1(Val) (adenine(37)-N6)-methyltransferase n=1 Tax=Ruegeria arenilitoris TaxID=1173585 RepID=UPI001480023B|nr:methyltransferase [Ruegeria arenilitoris]
MNRFSDSDLTCNDFLGGRLRLWQPRKGYRAGIDPVLLAASIPATVNQSVLELGCGAGAAVLCLMARVPELRATGVELQEAYAELAKRNAEDNKLPLTVAAADLNALPLDIRQQQFDHVLANPPYYRSGEHSPAKDQGRSIALGERTALSDWVSVAVKRLVPRGYLHIIQKADRLQDLLLACSGQVGSIEVLPIAPRTDRPAELVIFRARKGGRAAFRLLAPVVLHAGTKHLRDGDSYAPEISAILRQGAALAGFSSI